MLSLTDTPDAGLETVLEAGLAEYNATQVGRRDWRALSVTVHDPDSGELVGGLLGRTSLGVILSGFVLFTGTPTWFRRRQPGIAVGGATGDPPRLPRRHPNRQFPGAGILRPAWQSERC